MTPLKIDLVTLLVFLESEPTDGKIVFRKPKKRSSDVPEDLDKRNKHSKVKKIKNKSLLSFDDEEEENEDG